MDQKYDLKRWQIGEIASKIGQLYYHYYLRTSETNYLNEAFSFYSAIKNRQYYSKASKEERSDLMVKKLRWERGRKEGRKEGRKDGRKEGRKEGRKIEGTIWEKDRKVGK